MISLDRLQQIIPPDQALANKALGVALQQIAGISNNPMPVMANVIALLQTTRDLPLVNALSQPVPSSVTSYYTSTFNNNSRSTSNSNIVNAIGAPSGIGYTDPIANAIVNISTMNTSGLAYTYGVMLNCVNGVYNVDVEGQPPYVLIPSGRYAGRYTDESACFNQALIPGAQSDIAGLVSAYPKQTTVMNNQWFGMGAQFSNEQYVQNSASVNFALQTANSQNNIFGLIYSLPTYAQDTAQGGMSDYLEALSDQSTFTGQCIVGALREGRNMAALRGAGVTTNNTIPANPIPATATANLIPATYTSSEAADIISPTTHTHWAKGLNT
jgi:hypothetical protein